MTLTPVLAEIFSPLALVVLALLGLLIFGRRLPEVGKNLGKGIVEFKKGLAGVDDDAQKNAQTPPQTQQLPAASASHPALSSSTDSELQALKEQQRVLNEKLKALEQKSS